MPASVVQSIAKQSGKSVSEVEKLWKKAKGITKDKFNIDSEDNFSDRHWGYATGVTKKMAGISKEKEIKLTKNYLIEGILIPENSILRVKEF